MKLSEEQMAINRLYEGNTAHSRNASYIKLAIEALKKQIPKKPIEIDLQREYAWKCPSCGDYEIDSSEFYCPICGQKIDWGD